MDIALPNYPGNLILTQTFFPNAFADNNRLAACANVLWDVFSDLSAKGNMPDIDIPMKYFMSAVVYCIKNYGAYGKGIYFPDKAAWAESVSGSGLLKSFECTSI